MLLLGFGMFQGEIHPSPQIVYVDNSTEVIKFQELFWTLPEFCKWLVFSVHTDLNVTLCYLITCPSLRYYKMKQENRSF